MCYFGTVCFIIRFDLHAAAPAVTALAAFQLQVDGGNLDGNARRKARDQSHQTLPVRLARCLKSQHETRCF